MAFSEALKAQVRGRARFRCCRCHEIGVEVHHIVPQAAGGSDEVDNAAPLCPSCHEKFGANPEKRKEIREMRDLWYEIAREKWPTADDRVGGLNDAVLRSEGANPDLEAIAQDLRGELDRLAEMLNQPTTSKVREAASNIATTQGVISATRLGEGVYADVHCRACRTYIGLLVGTKCPGCGAPLS